MKEAFNYWWLLLLKGIILIGLSFYVFRHPVDSLVGLAIYFGMALLITGILIIAASLSLRKMIEGWGWWLAFGIFDLLFAFFFLSNPGATAASIPFALGFWLMVSGTMMFAGSFQEKKEGQSNWWLGLLGGVLIMFIGYSVATNLLSGVLTVTMWMGFGLLVAGIVSITRSLEMRKIDKAVS